MDDLSVLRNDVIVDSFDLWISRMSFENDNGGDGRGHFNY